MKSGGLGLYSGKEAILASPSKASVKCYSHCGLYTTFIKITWRAPLKMQIPTPHSKPTESESLGVEI